MLARALAVALVVAFLAGCSDAPGAPADAGEAAGPDCAPTCEPAPLDATSRVPVPAWVPGQWWEWQVSYAGVPMGETFRSIVVSADGQGRLLATEHPGRAKDEAAFDVLMLGEVGPGLELSRQGVEWDVLDFPLTDGKSWTTTLPNIAWDDLDGDTVQVAMSASFEPDLPGYRIMGHVEQGMVLEATYLPATGWFGEFTVYDIDEGDDPEEFRMVVAEAGLNYTGPYFVHSAELLLAHESAHGFDAPPPEGQPVLAPSPYASFTVPGDATTLFGFVEVFSAVGANTLVITPPDGNARYAAVPGTPDGGLQVVEFDEPAIAGQWHLGTVGAGGFSGVFGLLYAVTEGAYTM